MTDKTEREKQFYKKGYNYMSKTPIYIDSDKLNDQQLERLVESKNFCMLPWVHITPSPMVAHTLVV